MPREGARGAPLILKLKAENFSNRVGERPAIEKPIAMGRVQEGRVQMRASQAEDADLARTENLFRTIRRAAGNRKSERRAAAAMGRVQIRRCVAAVAEFSATAARAVFA